MPKADIQHSHETIPGEATPETEPPFITRSSKVLENGLVVVTWVNRNGIAGASKVTAAEVEITGLNPDLL